MANMKQPTTGTDSKSSPAPETEDVANAGQAVELDIDADVYSVALARAHRQGQALAAVARSILYAEAAKTPDDAPETTGRPPLREYGGRRKPLKFKVPRVSYQAAKDQIARSGRSVAAAVQDGLREFARTGNL